MRKPTLMLMLVLLAVALAHTSGGSAAAEEGTRVDSLSVTRVGGVAQVTGLATFVDEPVVVGTDAAGDATVAGVGADFTQAVMSRPDPFGDDLRVTIALADQPPVLAGVPEAICYRMRFTAPIRFVIGYRTSQRWATGSLEPHFRIISGNSAGAPYTAGWPLAGRMEDGVMEFDIPMDALGAQPLGTVAPTRIGAHFPESCEALNQVITLDSMALGEYVIPGATVALGMAPAGTPPSAIPLTVAASVGSDGAFAGSLSLSGLSSGTYVVLARACYGQSNCGQATATVSV